MKKKLVVLSGAGISAESGIPVFRGAGGLWEGYRLEEVATPEAWARDRELVLRFYNERRKVALQAEPNRGHEVLAELEDYFDVTVITQNIDNLHERAGSSDVVHLHGEIAKSQSSEDPNLVYDIDGWELKMGECCERGSQLRPHVVWFGEPVPMIEKAAEISAEADIYIVVGTSLQVYPAAGLVTMAPAEIPKFLVDPGVPDTTGVSNLTAIADKGSTGLERVKKLLLEREQ
ncbi:SIR2 family NAD-dependent protein deacylase [Halocola ammonii]